MSVYKTSYRAYTGRVTPLSSRVLVLARYGFQEAWSSKITIALFIVSLLPSVIFLVGIYLANNPLARALILKGSPALEVNAGFFFKMTGFQAWPALVLAAWIAPRLISFDLADNALPILLSHPISRFGYVFGKFLALFGSLSLVTWVPGMMLFAYQGYSSAVPWTLANWQIGVGLLTGALIWIVFISVLGLALSSWVKWRVVATGAIFAAVLVPAGVGAIVGAVLRTKWGLLLNLPVMMEVLWQRLLGAPDFWDQRVAALPTEPILVVLGLGVLLSVWMLNKRIRAREVVDGMSDLREVPNSNDRIVFEDVSKFYGEVLGVNRISISIPPGITTLVGPNGSGKTTLMNLMTGLVQPSAGSISVMGLSPGNATEFFRNVGYCTQFDYFPKGMAGWQFVMDSLMLHGMSRNDATRLTVEALERVQLGDAGGRLIAGYSKGMRQKIRLAQAIAHHPRVLVLDEPLNGLDPMARAESIALFEELGRQGMHLIISSHILDEVDRISDRVVLITGGYLIAEGNIHQVRQEVREKPMQVLIRCDRPELLAARMFEINHCVEARLHADGGGVFLRTGDVDEFYSMLNVIVAEGLVKIEAVAPADDDANAIYQYLIGSEGSAA